MNQRQLAGVFFAVVGVFVAISWLPQIVMAIGFLAQSTGANPGDHAGRVPPDISLLVATLITVLLGIVLVLVRQRLANRLFADGTGPLAARDTQAVALSVLGCYFGIGAIPRLVRLGQFGDLDWEAAVQLMLGIGLFLGARGVARFWAALRSAGMSSPDQHGD